MNKEEIRRATCAIYQEYYRQIVQNEDYVFVPNDKMHENKIIDTFIEQYIGKIYKYAIGIDFLKNYIESGFNYWCEETDIAYSRYGLASMKISWIIGRKAFERYERMKDIDNTKFSRKERYVRTKFGLDVDRNLAFLELDGKGDFLKQVHQHEEAEKKRFYNKPTGLLWCIDRTSLYNSESKLCESCNNSVDCKQILKLNFPKLYERRHNTTIK